jgi:hypothetical protein
LLGSSNAAGESSGEGGAEQGAAVSQGKAFTGVQNSASGSVEGQLTQVGDIGNGLFEGEAFGVVTIFDGQRRHG